MLVSSWSLLWLQLATGFGRGGVLKFSRLFRMSTLSSSPPLVGLNRAPASSDVIMGRIGLIWLMRPATPSLGQTADDSWPGQQAFVVGPRRHSTYNNRYVTVVVMFGKISVLNTYFLSEVTFGSSSETFVEIVVDDRVHYMIATANDGEKEVNVRRHLKKMLLSISSTHWEK